jgi:LmbE family N-acetylglucosaminyl deacetylase
MEFIDFGLPRRSRDLALIFPGWTPGERVGFFSPHDDDVLLGAGYLLRAVSAAGGVPSVFVFCRGDAGYSKAEDRDGIVERRRAEALAAYAALGVEGDRIRFFETPDFALMGSLDRKPAAAGCLFDELIRTSRRERITRIVVSSGHLEHWDHTAAFFFGVYTMPQAGDPILADLGPPSEVRSYLAYSVWADFAPAAESGAALRADCGILAPPVEEQAVRQAIAAFGSQGSILEKTIARDRDKRRFGSAYLELYQRTPVRKPIDYAAYFERLKAIP